MSSDLRPARPVRFIWAMPIPHWWPGMPRDEQAAGFCYASRISTQRGAAPSSKRKFWTTSSGWGCSGKNRSGGSRSISPITARHWTGSRQWACFTPALRPVARSRQRLLKRTDPNCWTRKARLSGEPFALRLDMKKALGATKALGVDTISFQEAGPEGEKAQTITAEPGRWGDVVLARKEAPTSYHLSVVLDDALQGITHVTRGLDLYAATDLHRLLQVLLELPEPVYHHHALLTDEEGRKLSKSHGDAGLSQFREKGKKPEDVIRKISEYGDKADLYF